MLKKEQKQTILNEVNHQANRFPSAAKQAINLGINPSQLSRIKKGDFDALGENSWITIARRLDVDLSESKKWVTAETPVFKMIYKQLEACQALSVSGIMCDIADIGKTHTAKIYSRKNKNAIYIDCSQVKNKQKLIKRIAKGLGVNHYGKYLDVYEDLVYYIRTLNNPLIILDEAGDLDYGAFLELKAMWNATEGACGWYMMGADGLKKKLNSNIDKQKVGYTEIFSRYGAKYQRATPAGNDELQDFKKTMVAMISKANKSELPSSVMYSKTGGSLRRIKTEIRKQNIA